MPANNAARVSAPALDEKARWERAPLAVLLVEVLVTGLALGFDVDAELVELEVPLVASEAAEIEPLAMPCRRFVIRWHV